MTTILTQGAGVRAWHGFKMACLGYRSWLVTSGLSVCIACGDGTDLSPRDGQQSIVAASVALTIDQFAPQSWQAPDRLNTFVLKSLNGEIVLGIAFTDAESLPALRQQLQGPVIDGDFATTHDFLAVFRFPWTTIGEENPQRVLESFVAGEGFGGVYSSIFGGDFRVGSWEEGDFLSGNLAIPFRRVVSWDANYPPRDWELTLTEDGQISLDFEGQYREWSGQPDTCFSPTQNIESATSSLGFGCSCDPLIDTQAPCVTASYDEDPESGYVFFMYCDPQWGQWLAGNDGPCGI